MARPLPLLVTVFALTASLLAGTTTAADARGDQHAKVERTRFAFNASGYGSQVKGGSVPANSDQTAFQIIACTNKTGIKKSNYTANLDIPGLGTVHGVQTDMWTEHKGGTYSSYSTHSIARIVLASTAIGKLEIRGVQSLARAYHVGTKFKTDTQTSIASITFTPTGGKPVGLNIPAPNKPIKIPGLATIFLGHVITKVTDKAAVANANALSISVIPLGTHVVVAQSRAAIGEGIKSGVFKGYSAGLRVSALDDNLRVGRTPLNPLACEGTDGLPVVKSTANAAVSTLLQADGVYAGNVASQTKTLAKGAVRGQVAHASVASNAIQADGVVAVVSAKRRPGGKVVTSDKGTQVLSLTINGQSYDLTKLPTINIPGLAKIQSDVHEKIPNGLRVIALRITLLDGTGAVVDLGVAQIQIRKGAAS